MCRRSCAWSSSSRAAALDGMVHGPRRRPRAPDRLVVGGAAQAEIFGDGDFRAASVAAPIGPATRTDDGWKLTARSVRVRHPVLDALHGPGDDAGDRERGPPRCSCSSPRRASGRCSTTGATCRAEGQRLQSIVFEGGRSRRTGRSRTRSWSTSTSSKGTPGPAAPRQPDVRRGRSRLHDRSPR